MKVVVSSSRDEMGKFNGVVHAFPEIWQGFVLDVGCRSGHLKRALPNGGLHYYGLDISSPANILANVEEGLPFRNGSYDTVVALDVLEHTNNIYRAFEELCRVARIHVVLVLPNLYEAKYRIAFLFGRRLSKYGLPPIPPRDRHRWLFSFREATLFTQTLGKQYGFEIETEGCLVGPRRGRRPSRWMVRLCPNLLSPCYIALLRRRKQAIQG